MVQVCSRNQAKLKRMSAKATAKNAAAVGCAAGSMNSPRRKESAPTKSAVVALARAPTPSASGCSCDQAGQPGRAPVLDRAAVRWALAPGLDATVDHLKEHVVRAQPAAEDAAEQRHQQQGGADRGEHAQQQDEEVLRPEHLAEHDDVLAWKVEAQPGLAGDGQEGQGRVEEDERGRDHGPPAPPGAGDRRCVDPPPPAVAVDRGEHAAKVLGRGGGGFCAHVVTRRSAVRAREPGRAACPRPCCGCARPRSRRGRRSPRARGSPSVAASRCWRGHR